MDKLIRYLRSDHYIDDELTRYLRSGHYRKNELENILNKKIMITKDHINNIKIKYYFYYRVDMIKLFEKYGYVFTDDDYIMLVKKAGQMLEYIPENKRTNKICKIAVQQNGDALYYVPNDKKTDELCEIAVQQYGQALQYIPEDKKTNKICEIAVQRDGDILKYVPEDKKTDEISKMAIQNGGSNVLSFIPKNKIDTIFSWWCNNYIA